MSGSSGYRRKSRCVFKEGRKDCHYHARSFRLYIKSPEFTGYLPAADFTPVDTTGAADAFIAALAVYLSSGFPIAKAAKIATYAAGFCVSRQGVIPALIDRNSLETYIKRIEPDIL